jgi:CRP-like cAMP-binding protein
LHQEFLRTIQLFEDLDSGQRFQLSSLLREERYPAFQLVFREGDPVDALFIVREGLVTVFREEPGQPQQVLARLEPGGFFGEMGLLNDKARRYASARTASPAVLLRIDKSDLVRVIAANPGLELKFRAEIIRRHGMTVSSLLGLAGQRDVRIRLGVAAVLEMEGGEKRRVRLEDLSIGGVSLSDIPDNWQPGFLVQFRLGTERDPSILTVSGTIAWREGDTAGVAFGPEAAGDARLVHRALLTFLDTKG